MSYDLRKQQTHRHRYFIDSERPDEPAVCFCGKPEGKRVPKGTGNKFGAIRTEHNGYIYDSRKEGRYAQDLDLRKRAGEILDWDKQWPLEVYIEGKHFFTTKVDFRLHMVDGSFELHEIKSYITARRADYRLKRKAIELFWLPKHPEYTYHEIQ